MKRILLISTVLFIAVLAFIFISRFFVKPSQNTQTFLPTPTAFQGQNPSMPATPTAIFATPTVQINPTSMQQQIKQAQADKAFANREQQIISTYPWFFEFPVLTDDYFLYFDLQQKQFIAKLYIKSSSSMSYDAQAAQFKKEVLQKLNDMHISTLQYPVSWVIVSQ